MQVLTLSGGGSFGSFEGGVLYELMLNGQHWDKVYGASAGAFNTLLVAQSYIDGSPEIIKKTWTETIQKSSQVYSKNWFNWVLSSPPYNYDPLRNLVKEVINFDKVLRLNEKFTVATCNLISGETVFFSNKDEGMTPERFSTALIASGSIPPLFDPISLDGMRLVDGGVRENLPLCKIIEDWDNDRVLAILCFSSEMDTSLKPFTGIIEIGSRSVSMMLDEITLGELQIVLLVNKLLEDLGKKPLDVSAIMPQTSLPGDTLDFSTEHLNKCFEIGRSTAMNFVKNPNLKFNNLKSIKSILRHKICQRLDISL